MLVRNNNHYRNICNGFLVPYMYFIYSGFLILGTTDLCPHILICVGLCCALWDTEQLTGPYPSLQLCKPRCLQTLPSVPWGAKVVLVQNHWVS